MEPHARSPRRRGRPRLSFPTFATAFALPLAGALAGCAADRPETDVSALVAGAVDLESAVALRVEAEPLDAATVADGALSFAVALREALVHSPALQAALARAAVAAAESDQARRLPNPVLSVLVRFPVGGGGADVEAGLSQELLGLLQRGRRAGAADARFESAAHEAANAALEVVAETRTRYAQAQAMDERAVLLGERRRIAERLLSVANARLQSGEATRLDVTTLQTRLLEVELAAATQETARRAARFALARQVGAPGAAADWTLDPWAPNEPLRAPERAWIEGALASHPELRARQAALAALGEEVAIAAGAWLDGASAGVGAERDREWSVGPAAELPLPLFDLGGARERAAEARRIAARHEFTQAQRRLVEEIRVALTLYESTRATLLRTRDELLPLQRQRRQQTEEIYLLGESDLTPVLLAESDLQQALEHVVDLEEQAATALARVERAVGGPAARRETEANR